MTAGPSRSPTPSPSPTPSSPPQRQAGSWSPPAVCREGCNWSCDGDATPAWPRAIVPPSHRSARRRRHREVDGHRGDRTAEDPTADRSRSALRRRSTSCRRPAATDPHVPSAPAPAGAAAGPFQRRRCCTQASELPTSEGRLLVGQPDGERGRVLTLLPYGSHDESTGVDGWESEGNDGLESLGDGTCCIVTGKAVTQGGGQTKAVDPRAGRRHGTSPAGGAGEVPWTPASWHSGRGHRRACAAPVAYGTMTRWRSVTLAATRRASC